MISSISFASLILVLVVGFVFRKVVRQAANQLPETAGDLLSTTAAAAKAVNENVLVLAAENAVDIRIRAQEIARKAEDAGVSGVDVTSLYNSIVGKA